jgi:hypothetical protein
VQQPRWSLGLILIPAVVFLFAFQPEACAALARVAKSAKAKVKAAQSGTKKQSKSAAKSSGKSNSKAASKGSASTKSSGKAGSKKGSAAKKGAHKGSSKAGAKGAGKRTAKVAKKPARQQQPEPERIRQIQQALKDRGYPLDVNGAWDANTVDALKKFQTEQNIENLSGRGKLDSLTLIALGLKGEPPSAQSEAPKRSPEGQFP